MFNGPRFIVRHVRDLDKTRTFYTDVLGFQVENDQPGFLQFTNTGGATFALGPEGAGEETEVWWFVDDADAAHEHLRAHGAEIVSPPKDEPFGRTVVIKDPAGTSLYLLQLPTQG